MALQVPPVSFFLQLQGLFFIIVKMIRFGKSSKSRCSVFG